LDVWDAQAVFYDLYGGVGLFGVCVCDLVGKVVLIEEVQSSLKLARHNVAYHKFENFFIHDGRVEDVLPSLVGFMPQARNIMMVDPPRAGLSEATVAMLNSVENINHLFYLSCNPQSLLDNCKSLKDHWNIRVVLPLDFFPRTQHLETLVVFEK
jgi:tRNA/tmRNA/rRNA uracil-C5-methylase (TrmA/RlmC/RlmD family)